MTKLIKKSVNIEKVLSRPHQSWIECLMTWVLSKPAIASVFVAIMGRFGKAFAEDAERSDAWNIAFGKVTDTFQYSRKMIFILAIFFVILAIVFALVKKAWYWLFSLFTWLFGTVIISLIIDYVTIDNGSREDILLDTPKTGVATINLTDLLVAVLGCMITFTICLLPIFIPLIQYKLKKIDKKLLKRRMFSWLMAGITCGVIIAIFVGIYMLLNSLG